MADRFQDIKKGDRAEVEHVITAADLDAFAGLTGDTNALHMDEAFAARTGFQKRVVHGMLTASFISTVIGTKLPGPGSLWYEQQLRFLAPVRIGERIVVQAEVSHKSPATRIITLVTDVYGEGGRKVIEGQAKVKVLEPEEKKMAQADQTSGPVIITGASRGIGAAIALALAQAGRPVVVNYRADEAGAEAVVERITAEGGRALAVRADLADDDAVAQLAEAARQAFGPLAGVVNNASPPADSVPWADLTWDRVQAMLDVQVRGAFNLCRAVTDDLIQTGGAMVNITSAYADCVPPTGLTAYVLAKAALVSLTRSLAVELGPKGVRVNAVAPGMTETDFIANVPEKAKMLAKMQTPLRRLGSPEDVAGTVAYLFSPAGRHVTGQTIRVCGGSVMI